MEKPNKPSKSSKKFILIAILIMITVTGLLFGLGLLWQNSTTLTAVANAFFLTAFIEFFIGWMVLMVNMNILSHLSYGLKSFFRVITGKKLKQDYYSYVEEKKEHPIPKYYIYLPLLTSVPNFIVSIILYILIY